MKNLKKALLYKLLTLNDCELHGLIISFTNLHLVGVSYCAVSILRQHFYYLQFNYSSVILIMELIVHIPNVNIYFSF